VGTAPRSATPVGGFTFITGLSGSMRNKSSRHWASTNGLVKIEPFVVAYAIIAITTKGCLDFLAYSLITADGAYVDPSARPGVLPYFYIGSTAVLVGLAIWAARERRLRVKRGRGGHWANSAAAISVRVILAGLLGLVGSWLWLA